MHRVGRKIDTEGWDRKYKQGAGKKIYASGRGKKKEKKNEYANGREGKNG